MGLDYRISASWKVIFGKCGVVEAMVEVIDMSLIALSVAAGMQAGKRCRSDRKRKDSARSMETHFTVYGEPLHHQVLNAQLQSEIQFQFCVLRFVFLLSVRSVLVRVNTSL